MAALLLRVLLALPALNQPESLLRPDSMGYWNPALALANGDGFVDKVGSVTPEMVRTIGYPAWLALIIRCCGNSLLAAALSGIVLSASVVFPLSWAIKTVSGERLALIGAWLYAFNITAIAVSPLILADTLLGLLAAWQLLFAVIYIRKKSSAAFGMLTVIAVVGTLVKPVNLPVVLVGLPVILLTGVRSWSMFFKTVMIYLIVTGGLLVPFWVKNHRLCGDFEGNTANIYFHNGSALMARAAGGSSEQWRQELLNKAEAEFAAHPEQYPTIKARNQWKKAQFIAMVKQYPVDALIVHLPNPFNLLPDVPGILENNHITSSGRGTMSVLRQYGFFAAVKHYLDGKYYLLVWMLPLVLIYAFTLLLAGYRLVMYLINWQWRWLLLFGVLVFYYIWAPGPVISPRYLLPGWPMIIFMAVHFKKISKSNNLVKDV